MKQNLTLNVHIHVVQYNLSIGYKKFTVCYLQRQVKALSYIDMSCLQRLLLLIEIICFHWILLESLGEHRNAVETPPMAHAHSISLSFKFSHVFP